MSRSNEEDGKLIFIKKSVILPNILDQDRYKYSFLSLVHLSSLELLDLLYQFLMTT